MYLYSVLYRYNMGLHVYTVYYSDIYMYKIQSVHVYSKREGHVT